MRYSDDIIEEVRERTDLVDLISGYVKLQRKGSSYFGLCPFHQEKTGSFSVSPNKQMYYCFGCGAGGNAYTFLMQYENASFQEAVQQLAERAGITLPAPEEGKEAKERADKRSALLQIQKEAASYYVHTLASPVGKRALAYLRGRGLQDATMLHFGLGYSDKYSNALYRHLKEKKYADDLLRETGLFHYDEKHGFSDKFWNRVMFPIMDANSRVIGFGGRVLGDGKPKYLNSPETAIFDKSRNLYGLQEAKKARKRYFLLCEGYMDVISLHQAGFTQAVASLGTALTEQQCALLARYTKEVRLLYDMDDAGVRAAGRAIPLLRQAGIASFVVNLRPCKDPDEFIQTKGAEALQDQLDRGENGFLFLVRLAEKEYDLRDPGGKADFLHRIADMLLEIPDEIERNSYLEALSSRYHVEENLLRKEVGKHVLRGTGRTWKETPRSLRKQKNNENTARGDLGQKMMLTWLSSRPGLFAQVQSLLGPEDFTNPLCREVADLLWKQASAGDIQPAAILDYFPDEEDQAEVASMFHTAMTYADMQDEKNAFYDVLLRMKRESLDLRFAALEPADLQGLTILTEEKKNLEQMQREGPPEGIFAES